MPSPRRVHVGDRVLCRIYNPVTRELSGRPFEGVVDDLEGQLFLVWRKDAQYLEPLRRREIIAALPPQKEGSNGNHA